VRDRESTDLAGAAYLAREADPGYDERPSRSEYEDEPAGCGECGAVLGEESPTSGWCWSCGERV
jgi:hypothetical protein